MQEQQQPNNAGSVREGDLCRRHIYFYTKEETDTGANLRGMRLCTRPGHRRKKKVRERGLFLLYREHLAAAELPSISGGATSEARLRPRVLPLYW